MNFSRQPTSIYLLACRRLRLDPLAQQYGIVGCGNVGGRLRRLLVSLGVEVIACDPPLEAAGVSGLSPLPELFTCNVISLHVPLTNSGRWPTHHMFNAQTFTQLRADTLLINACRGDVIEGNALKHWMRDGGRAALDVWPREPDIDPDLIQLATVASPHVAGYSLEGKLNATSMVYRDFCDHFGLSDFHELTPPAGPELDIATLPSSGFEDIILHACPIERDDQAMRARLGHPEVNRIQEYDTLRAHYPERRDFDAWTLKGRLETDLAEIARNLGFSVTNH